MKNAKIASVYDGAVNEANAAPRAEREFVIVRHDDQGDAEALAEFLENTYD